MPSLKLVPPNTAEWEAAQPDSVSTAEYAFNQDIQTFAARIAHNTGPTKSLSSDDDVTDNGPMETPINRAELDAKLETIEAKMDGRLLRMESIVERIGGDVDAIRTDVKSMKTTVITTAIAAVIAIVLGVAAFNAALTSNMLTAFQAGQQTAQHK